MERRFVCVDGNEAAARIAYLASEVIAIYPITPASPMGELADAWAGQGRVNFLGTVPAVVEMQSEGGAAGALHGALQAGALSTTFTASQGLLLMIPNMFKIAGELTPTVIHVAARAVATHALSIFGDHSDVMATRQTGWAMLCSSSVQEAQDMALIAHAATLECRLPFLHFFDGFRTSHELNKIEIVDESTVRDMLEPDLVRAHRERALDPDRPVLRGSAQNPDVFFQAREAANTFYLDAPCTVQRIMDRFAGITGRSYKLFDYYGDEKADRVFVMMGSGVGAAREAVDHLVAQGERVGLLEVRLYRPFSTQALIEALPLTARSIAVLDRTKEPGAVGEPLYQDVVTALAEGGSGADAQPLRLIGGRYGLSSKEFTPAMAAAAFAELSKSAPKRHFSLGIVDDVTGLSLAWDHDFDTERQDEVRAVFYGLGSDGTVSANKSSVKIINEQTDLHAQGYFVYDSKKSGAVTVSHVRFGPRPIQSSYLIRRASLVACHQFHFLDRMDVLQHAETGATLLLNCPYSANEVWDRLTAEVQEQIIERRVRLFVIDGHRIAKEAGLAGRINRVMQACFFALAGILSSEEAIGHIKESIRKTYGARGEVVVRKNFDAVDMALAHLEQVDVPSSVTSDRRRASLLADSAPDFVHRVTGIIMAGLGDSLPVSALPVDGTFPVGTAKYEKRSIAQEIPIWEPDICIQCGLCALVCPHAAIRTKVADAAELNGTPEGFKSIEWTGKEIPGSLLTIQVAPDDCTGCGVCVDVCPAKSKESVRLKAINMRDKGDHLAHERRQFEHFLEIPETRGRSISLETVKGSQLREPLFEYSGACGGCGETPYLKLLTQLCGDRMLVANATGCSSIYGGNLPTTPWSSNDEGRGPAWSNSLFEDNSEFGLGMRLAVDSRRELARMLVSELESRIGSEFAHEILSNDDAGDEEGVQLQRERVTRLKQQLEKMDQPEAARLMDMADLLVRRSVWIVGGDGWAYDIGFGGLDHVLSSGRDVNLLVLDTEVYSNTGGQASKSTPRAAVAKFAATGKGTCKKDLGMLAMGYGSVYVAQVAMGANPQQTIRCFLEAESYRGPSLIIAYSHCIAHGVDMSRGMSQQKTAVATGYWPLYHYDPRKAHDGAHPLHLDCRRPKRPLKDFMQGEARFAMLARANPQHAGKLLELAQRDVDERWHLYEQMAGVERTYVDQEVEA